MSEIATSIVRSALADTGVELVASCAIAAYDARAPLAYRSGVLMPGARGVIVAGSAGPRLWRRFRADMDRAPYRWNDPHPYDAFVAGLLARADRALDLARVGFRRFDAAFHAPMPVHFVALAQLVGLGSPGPFGLLIHPEHGPWWALRGAWLVDAEVEPATFPRPPCTGCAAPCIGGWRNAIDSVASATPEVRSRCVVGQGSRYDDDQIGYHYEQAATVARLRG